MRLVVVSEREWAFRVCVGGRKEEEEESENLGRARERRRRRRRQRGRVVPLFSSSLSLTALAASKPLAAHTLSRDHPHHKPRTTTSKRKDDKRRRAKKKKARARAHHHRPLPHAKIPLLHPSKRRTRSTLVPRACSLAHLCTPARAERAQEERQSETASSVQTRAPARPPHHQPTWRTTPPSSRR